MHSTTWIMCIILCQWWTFDTGIILVMFSANERRRYIVTPHFIGWVHTQILSIEIEGKCSCKRWYTLWRCNTLQCWKKMMMIVFYYLHALTENSTFMFHFRFNWWSTVAEICEIWDKIKELHYTAKCIWGVNMILRRAVIFWVAYFRPLQSTISAHFFSLRS